MRKKISGIERKRYTLEGRLRVRETKTEMYKLLYSFHSADITNSIAIRTACALSLKTGTYLYNTF